MLNTAKNITLLFLLGIFWSLGFSIARFCILHGIHPLGYAFWQALGPALLLSLGCKILRIPIFPHRSYFIFYLFTSLIGITLPNANMYFAAPHLPSGILAVMINIGPMTTYLFALAFKEEKFIARRFIGIITVVIGMMIIVRPAGDITVAMIPWILAALLSPISFSLCAIFIAKYRPKESHSLGLAAGMLWGATLWLLPIVLYGKYFYFFSGDFSRIDQLLIIEILLSSAGYWLFFQLLKVAGPVYYGLVGGIVSIAGLIWGKWFFMETLTLLQTASVALIILGVTLVSQRH